MVEVGQVEHLQVDAACSPSAGELPHGVDHLGRRAAQRRLAGVVGALPADGLGPALELGLVRAAHDGLGRRVDEVVGVAARPSRTPPRTAAMASPVASRLWNGTLNSSAYARSQPRRALAARAADDHRRTRSLHGLGQAGLSVTV